MFRMKKKDLLTQRIDALDTMSYPELKEKFRMLCSGDPGDTKSPGLRRRIAHRLQEIEYGSLSQEDRLKLEKIANADPLANLVREGIGRAVVSGMRLVREWKGLRHEVIATGKGLFEYNGSQYKSLSAIAREITGTRWNGKVFFGVK